MIAGQQHPAGLGVTTVRPSMDFETYSEAGTYFDFVKSAYKTVVKNKTGIGITGAWTYSRHPSTEVISLAYDLKDGQGPRLWIPGQPNPTDLFNHIVRGGIVSAFNSMFEYCVWRNVCAARMGWPDFPLEQFRDTQAKGMAFSLPAALEKAAEAIQADVKKNKEGKALIKLFSVPRTPTKADPSLRRRVTADVTFKVKDETGVTRDEHCTERAHRFYQYNIDDIRAEDAIGARVPDLSPEELELWILDQNINVRGCKVDREALDAFNALIPQFEKKYNAELSAVSGGRVNGAKESVAMARFITELGYPCKSVAKDQLEAMLADDELPELARTILTLRQRLAQSSVAKIPTIIHGLDTDNRARGMFAYYGAHTGRFAGRGAQPQNFPASGPNVWSCPECGMVYGRSDVACCGARGALPVAEWTPHAVECVIHIAKNRDLDLLEQYYPDPFAAISGCLRGLFMAEVGHDLIDSDYSAIEAVVLACLAGEQWRIDLFNGHGMIYEMSASKITGIPFEDFIRHKEDTGEHHPLRKKVGKVCELALGYMGGVGAMKAFGAEKFMTEAEMETTKKKWRAESPEIVNFAYGLERCAVNAVKNPGVYFDYRRIRYVAHDNKLFCILPSGRAITYHRPVVSPKMMPWGKMKDSLSYMGWKNNNWVRIDTHGGKLSENTTQAVARDVFTFAMVNLERAGYPIVLHTHDQITCEIPQGFGSIEEFEKIMSQRPAWCADWPIRAAGGWRGKRYRKD